MNPKEVFSENLKRYLQLKNKSQTDMASDLNYPEMTVSNWINAKTYPRIDKIQQMADYFGVNRSSLTEQYHGLNVIEPSFIKIPIIGKIACGDPVDSEENIEGYTFEMAQGLPTGDLYAVVATGESMEPTIKNGAHVIIKKQSTVDDGQIAAIRFRESGEITLKRVKRQGNIMLLIADNKEYEPIIVTHDNPADIVGRAIRITMNL